MTHRSFTTWRFYSCLAARNRNLWFVRKLVSSDWIRARARPGYKVQNQQAAGQGEFTLRGCSLFINDWQAWFQIMVPIKSEFLVLSPPKSSQVIYWTPLILQVCWVQRFDCPYRFPISTFVILHSFTESRYSSSSISFFSVQASSYSFFSPRSIHKF